jgi:hypothetical protein
MAMARKIMEQHCKKIDCTNYLRAPGTAPYISAVTSDLISDLNCTITCLTCIYFKKTDNYITTLRDK